MSFLDINFDEVEAQSSDDFKPLPAGWYMAKITGADLTPTKAGTGEYIKTRFDILGPTHEGRVVWANINIKNPNSQAESIGRGQLKAIRDAIGLANLTDTDQLIGGDLQIKLTVKNDEQYGDGNEVKGFKAINGSEAPAPSAAPSSGGAAKAPWQK